MSAQRIATGIAVAALAGLFFSVGLPPLLPPAPVAEIVVPTGDGNEPIEPRQSPPAGQFDHPDGGSGGSPGDYGEDDGD